MNSDVDNTDEMNGQVNTSRLVKQYTEIARLAGGLAHEIKNPLSTIHLNLDLLAEDFEDSEVPRDKRALSKIRTVQRECKHLQEILDDFLRFARVKDVRLKLENLNEVIEELVAFYTPQARLHQIEIHTFLATELPWVQLDRPLFQQAILNLIINAQRAMPQGGQLTLQTHFQKDHVKLEVIDTGCGMSPETLEESFEVFFSTTSGGSGLGLPTSRKIIEAHQGTVTAESAINKGTRFSITLPLGQSPETQNQKL